MNGHVSDAAFTAAHERLSARSDPALARDDLVTIVRFLVERAPQPDVHEVVATVRALGFTFHLSGDESPVDACYEVVRLLRADEPFPDGVVYLPAGAVFPDVGGAAAIWTPSAPRAEA